MLKMGATYVVIGDEVGAQGTRHFQGYAHFARRIRKEQLGKHFKGHFEPMRSNPTLASAYCKKDGKFIEAGALPQDGAAATQDKWADIKQLAKRRKFGTIADLYPAMYIRCHRGIHALESAMDVPDLPDYEVPQVYWFFGKPGCGKSAEARRITGPNFYEKDGSNIWWTDYKYEENVIIDEMPTIRDPALVSALKKWTDAYPCTVTWKMSPTIQKIRPKVIVITSQKSIDETLFDPDDVEAMKRRCVQIKEFISPDNVKVHKDGLHTPPQAPPDDSQEKEARSNDQSPKTDSPSDFSC